ncbi:MAG: biotin synthase [Desulfitibacter sp. BRH_c19]|nr:MAG: biotin synthase [Desulfitibacter sp. BRH_c19]
MDLEKKVEILSESAKYDVSCSSSGSKRRNTKGGIGNGAYSGICHSWSEDGRCISLLKILYTNYCIYDCIYCINRHSNDIQRAAFTSEELAELTINFYRRNYIEGLFLSSGIIKNPDYTMEQLIKVMRLLRETKKFNGYIHVKAIPGADSRLISIAGQYADRMSVNIELPTGAGLSLLAPQKTKTAIVGSMGLISNKIKQNKDEKRTFKKVLPFAPAGQSTQLIIGATPDDDLNILSLSQGLYGRFGLKRVYYSAYVPVNTQSSLLPSIASPPMVRENRLYQADWLLRFYGFKAEEILNEKHRNLELDLDPKSGWALRNMNIFPIEINKADYEMLLRVPGIGVKSARKILASRRVSTITFDGLQKIGVILKRARHFITCQGKYYGEKGFNEELIRLSITNRSLFLPTQLTIFSEESLNS